MGKRIAVSSLALLFALTVAATGCGRREERKPAPPAAPAPAAPEAKAPAAPCAPAPAKVEEKKMEEKKS